jgi:hypothetical protein
MKKLKSLIRGCSCCIIFTFSSLTKQQLSLRWQGYSKNNKDSGIFWKNWTSVIIITRFLVNYLFSNSVWHNAKPSPPNTLLIQSSYVLLLHGMQLTFTRTSRLSPLFLLTHTAKYAYKNSLKLHLLGTCNHGTFCIAVLISFNKIEGIMFHRYFMYFKGASLRKGATMNF